MKKINVLLITVLTLTVFSFISCTKDDSESSATGTLPSEILFDKNKEWDLQGFFLKFTYDDNNRIIKHEYGYSGTSAEYAVFDYTYNSSGELTSISYKYYDEDGERTSNTNYTYSGNFVTAISEDDDENKKYELQDGKIFKEYSCDPFLNLYLENRTFSYDSEGNITKILYSGSSSDIISYGNKKGIFSGVNMPNWLMLNSVFSELDFIFHTVNNPVTIQSDDYSCSWEYLAYNRNDYPTKAKIHGLYEVEIKYIDAK